MIFQTQFPNDSGPIYQETIAGNFPVEPFNTFSNFLYLIILIYFICKIYKKPKQHIFLWIAFPIIFISWIGGIMYHGTRSHEYWMLMDYLPIILVCFLAMGYFIMKIYKSWLKRVGLFLGLFIPFFLADLLPISNDHATSVGYAIMGLGVMIPFFWYASTRKWKNVKLIAFGFPIYGLAIICRYLDSQVVIFPMGTHFLWHAFGALATFLLLRYIYLDDLSEAQKSFSF